MEEVGSNAAQVHGNVDHYLRAKSLILGLQKCFSLGGGEWGESRLLWFNVESIEEER